MSYGMKMRFTGETNRDGHRVVTHVPRGKVWSGPGRRERARAARHVIREQLRALGFPTDRQKIDWAMVGIPVTRDVPDRTDVDAIAGKSSGSVTDDFKVVTTSGDLGYDLNMVRDTGNHPSRAVRDRLRDEGLIFYDRAARFWKVARPA